MGNPFENYIESQWQQYQLEHQDERYPNVMVLGGSGVGKSSLINTVFGSQVAPISHTSPKTQGYCSIYRGKEHGSSVNLIDTAGYELGVGEAYHRDLQQAITAGVGDGPVHAVWFCVAVTNENIQDVDLETLRRLSLVPEIRRRILVVFTKCDEDTPRSDKARLLAGVIRDEIGPDMLTFETSSMPGYPLDLPRLIVCTADLFDDADLRQNFIAAQRTDIAAKRDAAQQVVRTAAAGAALIGAIPIPIADAALLVPAQTAMMGKIVEIFGLRSLGAVSEAAAGNVVISQLGKSLAVGLGKLIPVIGPWIDGIVNAAVASSITYALGSAAAEVCAVNVERALRGELVCWSELFTSPTFLNLTEQLFARQLQGR